jgi:two-component system chemotaxis sensor kinase CheA
MDDTLPLIDEAVAAQIALGQHLDDPESLPAYRRLTLRLRQLQDNALATRMVAAGSLFPILRRTLRETARTTQKEVRWQASGEEVLLDRAILEALRDPLQQIVRNAVAHGIECDRTAAGKPVVATLAVDATNEGSEVIITIRDDGAGINLARVRTEAERQGIATAHLSSKDLIDLLFRPGFSTAPVITQSAGRGIGLDIVAAAIAKVRGHISVQTSPAGTEFKITVPNTLAVIPCALVAAAGQQFGLPLASVLAPDAAQDTNPIVLGSLLGLPEAACGPTITIADSGKRLTLQVDALDGQRDIIVRPLRGPLPPLDILTGAGLNPDGSIIIILRPAALLALAFGCGLSPVQP